MSVKIYYTGATNFGDSQPDPNRSLGGYPSSSALPNGQVNALFGAISQTTVDSNKREVRAVALKNETGGALTDVEVFYENVSNAPVSNYRMAVVMFSLDDCGNPVMEKIDSGFSVPVVGNFVDNRGQSNAIVIPNLPDQTYIGLWIERTINPVGARNYGDCQALYDAFSVDPVNQVSTTITVADVAESLSGTYWTFETLNGKFYVWYDTGSSTDPQIVGYEAIRVSISPNDSDVAVAIATQTVLDAILNPRGEAQVTVSNNTITITNLQPGATAASDSQTSGFTTSISTPGASSAVENIEDVTLSISY